MQLLAGRQHIFFFIHIYMVHNTHVVDIDVVQYMAIWPPINMHYGHLLWFNYFGQHIGGGSGQD